MDKGKLNSNFLKDLNHGEKLHLLVVGTFLFGHLDFLSNGFCRGLFQGTRENYESRRGDRRRQSDFKTV
jgi:hypothetical protein